MKKFFFLLLITLLITGCNKSVDINTIDEVKIDDLVEYKGTNLGDNSRVGSIISILPGGGSYREFELNNGNAITVVYGVKEGSTITDETFSDYWLNNDTIEKNFLYNALSMFILIENLEEITLKVDSDSYYSVSFERESFERGLPSSFKVYRDDVQIWKNELVDGIVNLETERENIFKEYPIQTNSK